MNRLLSSSPVATLDRPEVFPIRAAHGNAAAGGPLRVCLLIGGLGYGGAERQVMEMAATFDRRRIDPIICSLSAEVPLAAAHPAVRELVHIVPKRGRFDFGTVFRLAGFFRRERIDVVHAFLFDAEIAGRLAAPLAGVKRTIASERNADYVRPPLHQAMQMLTKPLFSVMVANSHAGARFSMRTLGLAPSRVRVVHNGVDTAHFRQDPESGRAMREKLGIDPEAPVVGMAGSFKRQKDHATFLRMAARVRRSFPACRFIIAGDVVRGSGDSTVYAREIHDLAGRLGLRDCCLFPGNIADMKSFYNACDVTALLSLREGTPNVALESMACGVPVIASDIADNRWIIRDGITGHVVPPGSDVEASERVAVLLGEPENGRAMGRAARERICDEFSLERAAAKLADIYCGLPCEESAAV